MRLFSLASRRLSVINSPRSFIAAGICIAPLVFAAGCGGDSIPVAVAASPSPSPTAPPSVNRKLVSLNIGWAGRTRGLGIEAGYISSAQSARIRFYEGGSRTDTPSATVVLNRDAARLEAHRVSINTGAVVLDIRRICLIEGTFYAGSEQTGATVGTVSFQSRINKDTFEAENAVFVAGVVRTVRLSVPAIGVGRTVDVVTTATDATGNAIVVTPGSVSLSATQVADDTQKADNVAVVAGAANDPVRLRGVRAGAATLRATIDSVTSDPVTIVVAP